MEAQIKQLTESETSSVLRVNTKVVSSIAKIQSKLFVAKINGELELLKKENNQYTHEKSIKLTSCIPIYYMLYEEQRNTIVFAYSSEIAEIEFSRLFSEKPESALKDYNINQYASSDGLIRVCNIFLTEHYRYILIEEQVKWYFLRFTIAQPHSPPLKLDCSSYLLLFSYLPQINQLAIVDCFKDGDSIYFYNEEYSQRSPYKQFGEIIKDISYDSKSDKLYVVFSRTIAILDRKNKKYISIITFKEPLLSFDIHPSGLYYTVNEELMKLPHESLIQKSVVKVVEPREKGIFNNSRKNKRMFLKTNNMKTWLNRFSNDVNIFIIDW